MALIFMDGFGHYGADETNMTDGAYAQIDAGWGLSTVNPRTGTTNMRKGTTAGASVLRRVLGGAKTTVAQAVAAYFSELPTQNDFYVLYDFRDTANAIQISVVIQSTGIIAIKRGDQNDTEIIDSVTPAVVAEAYQHIETAVTFDDTVGAVEVRVNGVTVIATSGVDTTASLNQECSQVGLICGNNSFVGGSIVTTTDIDDYFCWDDTGSYNNDFIGDRRVLTLLPTADTAQADWSWNTGGSGYLTIDDTDPDDDTTYLLANPGGSPSPVSEFDITDLPAGVSSVSAIVLVNRMRKTDASTANVQPSIVSGAAETAGTDHPLTEAYTYYHDVIETDPDTAAPFTPTAANAIKIKLDRTQ